MCSSVVWHGLPSVCFSSRTTTMLLLLTPRRLQIPLKAAAPPSNPPVAGITTRGGGKRLIDRFALPSQRRLTPQSGNKTYLKQLAVGSRLILCQNYFFLNASLFIWQKRKRFPDDHPFTGIYLFHVSSREVAFGGLRAAIAPEAFVRSLGPQLSYSPRSAWRNVPSSGRSRSNSEVWSTITVAFVVCRSRT